MKHNRAGKILTITALACVLIFAVGVLIYGLSTGFGISDLFPAQENDAFETPYTYTEETESLRNIRVDWVSGPITLKFYEGEVIQVTETSRSELEEDEKLLLERDGSDLTIRWNSSLMNVGFARNTAKQLEILIPQKFYDKLESVEILSASGDITVENLEAAEVKFKSVSGNIGLNNISAEDFTAVTTSGRIVGENLAGTESFEAGSTSGEILLTNIHGGETKLDNTSGSVSASGAVSTLKCGTVSGAVQLGFTVYPQELSVETVSGSAEIIIPKGDSGFLCDFSSVSGELITDFDVTTTADSLAYGSDLSKAVFRFSTTSGDVTLSIDESSK